VGRTTLEHLKRFPILSLKSPYLTRYCSERAIWVTVGIQLTGSQSRGQRPSSSMSTATRQSKLFNKEAFSGDRLPGSQRTMWHSPAATQVSDTVSCKLMKVDSICWQGSEAFRRSPSLELIPAWSPILFGWSQPKTIALLSKDNWFLFSPVAEDDIQQEAHNVVERSGVPGRQHLGTWQGGNCWDFHQKLAQNLMEITKIIWRLLWQVEGLGVSVFVCVLYFCLRVSCVYTCTHYDHSYWQNSKPAGLTLKA
jgi:hypothetical protein